MCNRMDELRALRGSWFNLSCTITIELELVNGGLELINLLCKGVCGSGSEAGREKTKAEESTQDNIELSHIVDRTHCLAMAFIAHRAGLACYSELN